ncbi:MAG TPA: F0F1 ATP synthase subunit A [Bryobacteraceae bacterium]|jgi:F-type H+-transporting ATPase subunit a|nr:F0F1 ATP synthase subunit A [Bryobacteraceae bacterium]
MPEHELWLTALFNDYLAGIANAVLGAFNIHVENQARPWATWIVMELLVVAILMALAAVVRSSLSPDKPGKLQHVFELLYGFLKTQASEVGIHHPEKYSAFFGTLFVFVLAMNLIGAIPIFESPTMEVAVPVGLALSTWVYYHVMGVRELGPLQYMKHFLGPVIWLAPIMVFIEIIGHFARMLSLSVRLYGNMLAGEQITNAFIGLTYLIVPVIFMGLHVFVAFLQAYVFALLAMIYVSMATAHEH